MSRYGKYFLQHILWLKDGFCQYYVQNLMHGPREIPDVESMTFSWSEKAEQWLLQCAHYDAFWTSQQMRSFLAYRCLDFYALHRMDDAEVLRAVAYQLTHYTYRIVIKPVFGLSVRVATQTFEPAMPLSVEPASDVEQLIDHVKEQLDALVAGQKKKYNEWEAKLAGLDESEKALLYGKQTGDGLYNATIGGVIDLVKSLPQNAKTMWQFKTYPLRMARAVMLARRRG